MPNDAVADRLYKLVGERVRKTREAKRITQDALASKVGVSRTSITNLECGRQKPPLHQLMRVADALEADLRELLPSASELNEKQKLVEVTVGKKTAKVPEQTARLILELKGQ